MTASQHALPSCEGRCHTLAHNAARIAAWAMILFMLCAPALAETPQKSTRDVLRQAALYQKEFRTGNMAVFPDYVVMLDEATESDADNADLWYALGVAAFGQAAAVVKGGGSMADVGPAFQQGQAALARALELDPEHPEALALRGGTRMMMTAFVKKPELVAAMTASAIADMNRAVEISPTSERARLQRAFSGLVLADELRNHEAEAADLDFLMKAGGRSRAGDYMRIMRADLHAELGEADLARALYKRVERSTSPAAAEASARLATLELGAVPLADIKALRVKAGAECTMCHGN
jgi:tetratricopeptide (TPR) repeat protein